MHYAVCAKKCPKKDEAVDYHPNKKFKKDDQRLKKWGYDTKDVMGFCFPSADTMKEYVSDIKEEVETNK